MFLVTVIKEQEAGVEVAGIFDTEEKANEAKKRIRAWMNYNECDDYVIFITPCKINCLAWYELTECF